VYGATDLSTVVANVFAGISTVAALVSVWLAWKAIAEARAQQKEARVDSQLRAVEGLILPIRNLQLSAVAADAASEALAAYHAQLESVQVRLLSLPPGDFTNCQALTKPALPPQQAIALCEPALGEIRAAINKAQEPLNTA
jgi:hypothetical protein